MPPIQNRKTALSEREIDFLDRVTTAANLLAMPGLKLNEAVEQFIDLYPDTTEETARKWLLKGREYIRTGAPCDQMELQRRYAAKLRAMIDRASKHLVTDFVEVVTEDEPALVLAAASDDTAKADEAVKQMDGGGVRRKTKTKRRPNVYNVQVGNLIAKLMKEEAVVTGARPKDGQSPKPGIVNNTQINVIPGASRTADLATDQLLRMAGLTNVKVLPGQVGDAPRQQPEHETVDIDPEEPDDPTG